MTIKPRTIRFISILILTACCYPVFAESQDWKSTALKHMQDQEPQKALSILEPLMETEAGNVEYDVLLGNAALANNQPNLAVFALERVVLTKPTLTAARFTLAKAYLGAGEKSQAKRELNYILSNSRESHYKDLSNDLLSHMDGSSNQKYAMYFKIGFGNDSNANSATDENTFLGINLSTNSQAISSPVLQSALNGHWLSPISGRINLLSGFNLFNHDYANASFVDTTGASLFSSLQFRTSASMTENLHLQITRYNVNEKLNNQQAIAQFSHTQKLNKKHLLGLSTRLALLRYASEFSIKDTNNLNLGSQYQYRHWSRKYGFIASTFSVITGLDRPNGNNQQYARQYSGVQLGLQMKDKSGKAVWWGNIHYLNANYKTPFFGESRNDISSGISAGLDMLINKKWKLSPGMTYINNQSTVDLYQFQRSQVLFSVSHQII